MNQNVKKNYNLFNIFIGWELQAQDFRAAQQDGLDDWAEENHRKAPDTEPYVPQARNGRTIATLSEPDAATEQYYLKLEPGEPRLRLAS